MLLKSSEVGARTCLYARAARKQSDTSSVLGLASAATSRPLQEPQGAPSTPYASSSRRPLELPARSPLGAARQLADASTRSRRASLRKGSSELVHDGPEQAVSQTSPQLASGAAAMSRPLQEPQGVPKVPDASSRRSRSDSSNVGFSESLHAGLGCWQADISSRLDSASAEKTWSLSEPRSPPKSRPARKPLARATALSLWSVWRQL